MSQLLSMALAVFGAFLGQQAFFVSHPDFLEAVLKGLEAAAVLGSSLALSLASKSDFWKRVNRVVGHVAGQVEAEAFARSDPEKRSAAIKAILDEIPLNNLGWRAAIFQVPILGKWVIGTILDRLVPVYKDALRIPTLGNGSKPDAGSVAEFIAKTRAKNVLKK